MDLSIAKKAIIIKNLIYRKNQNEEEFVNAFKYFKEIIYPIFMKKGRIRKNIGNIKSISVI